MQPSQRRGRAAVDRYACPRRYALLGLEPLEARHLLTTAIPSVDAQAWSLDDPAGEVAAEFQADSVDGAPVLYRHGVAIQTFTPDTDTDIDRGAALRAALQAAQFGDQIRLPAATYDMGGTEHIEFPAGVTVTGEGKSATKITSSVPISIDPSATYTLNNQTTVEDLWLEGSLHNGYYQTLVGMAGSPTEDVTTYLRRVKITGDSDGIFIWTGQQYQYTLQAFDCEISTNYDAVALLGSSPNRQTVQMWNCTITAAQPSAIPAHNSNAVNIASGLGQFYNCTINAIGDADSMRTNAALVWNQGQIELRNCTLNSTAPPDNDSYVYDFEILDSGTIFVTGGQGSGPGGSYISNTGTEVYQGTIPVSIGNRGLFYNNSAFDDYNPLPGTSDDLAMATDKSALRPGNGTATFANVSSAIDGINGLTIDLVGYHGDISADDLAFKVGNNNAPSTWTNAPAPLAVDLFGGQGLFGTDRVRIIWADGAITNTWLEVTLLANDDTGISTDDVFYFGNAVGDSGAGDSSGAMVNTTDEQSARNDPHGPGNPADVENPNDFNRDTFVNATDQSTVRFNPTNYANQLLFINVDPPEGQLLSTQTEPTADVAADQLTSADITAGLSTAVGKRPAGIRAAVSTVLAVHDSIALPRDRQAQAAATRPLLVEDRFTRSTRQLRAAAFAGSEDWLDDCLQSPELL